MNPRFRTTANREVGRIRTALYRLERAATVPAQRPPVEDVARVTSMLRDAIDAFEARCIAKEATPLF